MNGPPKEPPSGSKPTEPSIGSKSVKSQATPSRKLTHARSFLAQLSCPFHNKLTAGKTASQKLVDRFFVSETQRMIVSPVPVHSNHPSSTNSIGYHSSSSMEQSSPVRNPAEAPPLRKPQPRSSSETRSASSSLRPTPSPSPAFGPSPNPQKESFGDAFKPLAGAEPSETPKLVADAEVPRLVSGDPDHGPLGDVFKPATEDLSGTPKLVASEILSTSSPTETTSKTISNLTVIAKTTAHSPRKADVSAPTLKEPFLVEGHSINQTEGPISSPRGLDNDTDSPSHHTQPEPSQWATQTSVDPASLNTVSDQLGVMKPPNEKQTPPNELILVELIPSERSPSERSVARPPDGVTIGPSQARRAGLFLHHDVKSYSIDQPDAEHNIHSPTQLQTRREHFGFYQQQQLRQQQQRARKNALCSTSHAPGLFDETSSNLKSSGEVQGISQAASSRIDDESQCNQSAKSCNVNTAGGDSVVIDHDVIADVCVPTSEESGRKNGVPSLTSMRSAGNALFPTADPFRRMFSSSVNPSFMKYRYSAGIINGPGPGVQKYLPDIATVTAAHQYPTVSKMLSPHLQGTPATDPSYEAVRISDVGDGYVYLNQYKLSNETLGHGTYSIVKLAYNTEDNTHYAMKILSKKKLIKKHRMSRKSGDPMQEAYREIAILKKLNHPNIIRLIEVLDDPSEDGLYMVFELLERGEVLVVPTDNPLSEDLAWKYFRDLILGVEYLHHNGILHRDLKPSNLLLDDGGHLKIADFGLSHMFEGSDALLTGTVGTPAFHAPEILYCDTGAGNLSSTALFPPPKCGTDSAVTSSLSSSSSTPGSSRNGKTLLVGVSGVSMDIWSMGITLFSLVFGDVPFRDEFIVGLHNQIRSLLPSFPEEVVISDSLQDLILRLLEKNPDQRISLAEIREHPWVTRNGRQPLLPPKPENCKAPIEVTEEEIQASVRSIPHLDTLILIKAMLKRGSFHHPFKAVMSELRKASLDSNFPPI